MDFGGTALAVLAAGSNPMFLPNVAVLAISIFVLSKASEFAVRNALSIARATRMGELSTGFLMMSLATNLPELAVAATALLSGGVDLSVGNILGSNIVNVGLVLAVAAMIRPIVVRKGALRKLPFMLFICSIIPLALLLESGWVGPVLGLANPGRIVGTVLLATFVVFAVYSIRAKIDLRMVSGALVERTARRKTKGRKTNVTVVDLWKKTRIPFRLYRHVAYFVISLALVVISAEFAVSSSVSISNLAGIAPALIGATVISIGTSLPELSLAVTSVKGSHFDLALGNIIGSSLTKITLVLGILLFFAPGGIGMGIFSTLLFFVILTSALAWSFVTSGRTIDRREGMILLLVYIASLIAAFGVQLLFIG